MQSLAAQFAADFDDDEDDIAHTNDTNNGQAADGANAMDVDAAPGDVADSDSDEMDEDEETMFAREKALADAVRGANSVFDVTKLYKSKKLENLLQVRFGNLAAPISAYF